MRAAHFELPKFVLAAVDDPEGFKPGRYYYVLFMEQMRKVSRYHRRASTIHRKLIRYTAAYAAGDREWPEVGREDELRDSPDAVPTMGERFRVMLWGHE